MRPLRHPPMQLVAESRQPMGALALQAFGPFCAISERTLPAAYVLWNAKEHHAIDVRHIIDDQWQDCLLLDQSTFNIIQHKELPADIILPHKNLTFSVQHSPLQYDLIPVDLVMLDQDNVAIGEPATQELVVVSASTPQAQQTIDFFALNGERYDAEKKRLTMTQLDYMSMSDTRIFDRTRVWQQANKLIEGIKPVIYDDDLIHKTILNQARLTASMSGFWSVWATLLWRVFENKEVVGGILAQGPEEREKLRAAYAEVQQEFIPELLGHGPDNSFPGTRSDWLE